MDEEIFGSIPLIERAKIQAQVLVPILQAFRAELGEERANRIAWQALAQWRRDTARGIAAELPGSPRERWQEAMAASLPLIGDSVDFAMLKQSEGVGQEPNARQPLSLLDHDRVGPVDAHHAGRAVPERRVDARGPELGWLGREHRRTGR